VTILPFGPDGMILVYALIVSIVVALLSWRRVGFGLAGIVVLVAAVLLAVVQGLTLEPADPVRQRAGLI